MTPSSHTWVLLRGLTREQGHWGNFPHRLAAALPPGSVVLTPDIAGNGTRHAEASPATVGAWQVVAHWSMLFVRPAIRASFCMR